MTLYSTTLYSNTVAREMRHLTMQGTWSVVGVFICVTAALCDYRWLKKVAWPLFIVAVGALAAVLIFTAKVNGSRRWIPLGSRTSNPLNWRNLL